MTVQYTKHIYPFSSFITRPS